MPDEFNSPALRISNIVHGRRNVSDRVEYMLDPKGQDTSKFEIPEQIVLTRWRQRKSNAYVFGGMRLSPNIWRSVKVALGKDWSNIERLESTEIDKLFKASAAGLKSKKYKAVNGENLLKLVEGLGITKFNALMTRHNDPERSKIYGTPDLFVWAISRNNKEIDHVRFIEVKKPREPLSEDQVNELHYLNFDLKVKARVLRLREARPLSQ
ncbi:VRR-NUC domain-containing protein [Planktomarina temperata]|nr:VRR-NUC domain-containing protein [Planktomarina temperata]